MSWNREELRVWFSLFCLQLILLCMYLPYPQCQVSKCQASFPQVPCFLCGKPITYAPTPISVISCTNHPNMRRSHRKCLIFLRSSCPGLNFWVLAVSFGLAVYNNVYILYRVFSQQHRILGLLRFVVQSLNYTSPMPLLFHYAFVKISIF